MRFSRLLPLAAAFALSPALSFALPVQCADVCPESYDCTEACGQGARLTTCGKAGYACVYPASPSDPTASVTTDEARQAETAPVCSEQQPDAERGVTAET